MLNVEDSVVEFAIHPTECTQFASTSSQSCIQKYEKLVAEFEPCQHFPLPTGMPDDIGLWPQNSQRSAGENKADITHLILALVPFATSVASSHLQRYSSGFLWAPRRKPGYWAFALNAAYGNCKLA